jgi:hypothetical protein
MMLGEEAGSMTSNLSVLKDAIFHFGEFAGVLIFGMGLGIISIIRKNKVSLKWDAKKETSQLHAHSRVHETLTELRVTVRASRALIFQYHNGGKFSDGTSMKRFSVTHESCANGVIGMMLESQDVLLTRYIELIGVIDEQANQIIRVSTLPECTLRSILEINNVVYFSVGAVKCVDSLTPMGFVCCHWCDVGELDELHEEGFDDGSLSDVIKNSIYTINNQLIHAQK